MIEPNVIEIAKNFTNGNPISIHIAKTFSLDSKIDFSKTRYNPLMRTMGLEVGSVNYSHHQSLMNQGTVNKHLRNNSLLNQYGQKMGTTF